MSNEIVQLDTKLDELLGLVPTEAVRLIAQGYQIAYDKDSYVLAMAAKLVTLRGMTR
jgi:hypothetical protein